MSHLNTKPLLGLTRNTPGVPSRLHIWSRDALCCFSLGSLVLICNSGYEHAVLLAKTWLGFSKPENTSKWSLEWQPEPGRL